ncbi:MAG: transposase [Azospirillaceae bacterium]|nr:transposase [Azospirillaceae bacterium]
MGCCRLDRIEAPWLLNKPVNGQRFQVYVEEVLTPTLNKGDVVIMDNLPSHKAKAIRDAGAKLIFLPKYSIHMNAIEKFFSKLKYDLREAQPRSIEALCKSVVKTMYTVTPTECSNYFRSSGDGPT